jgi:Phosphotransferase enzyme family
VSEPWLASNLTALRQAAGRATLAGGSVVHLDVRSDNLCFRDGRALIVDWNWMSLGNPAFDAQFWLPSLVLEGGVPPIDLEPDYAAWMLGYFAARAGLPSIPDAPDVRPIQLAQLKVLLPWVCRLLGIEPPDDDSLPEIALNKQE